mmetsp:Transcript_18508/g.44228  ORF Transcript_18508/g.44228 Transcript_18508/m.44228 type:complete len:442 (-) Transcript_18508:271-1596(-)|eukprot:CAMPEP_0177599498 /NCGR_PEP_ID=MMETSP0419_2-20121207/13030_1 /TAXON_ID=582737 /ORGANISM="Tetraselmis sp., Strain GSL018" /LENGTH=441 /DNA_ID=CAMNT_0019092245 /DNA_START=97 /DNA_END=1422 /DNA_ORIENTATION=-
MNEEYDAVVLGTGLKECILSGLLSVKGLKVLHMDRNNYYGGESASLSLKQLWEKFRPGQEPPQSLGPSRDYNVDIVPKFIMGNGKLVRVLVHTDVTKYLEFKAVDGSYVYVKGKVNKVPSNDYEALRSPLMGMFEKRRARNFFLYLQDYRPQDPKTHSGMDLSTMTMAELYTKYGLQPETIDFIGHAIALHREDSYLAQPALPTVMKIKLYNESLLRFEGVQSPYIYPLYGLGELPQAFARLSAVHGGTYMLDKPDAKVVFDDSGKAIGVESGGEVARCKFVVGDPSYFPGKFKKVGQVVRAMCILNHPIPDTHNAHSAQIILPQKQLNRKHDIYVFCCSYSHNVAPQGKWVAFVSTTVETSNPEAELAPGLALLGEVEEKFVLVSDFTVPTNDPNADNCFISQGYDATTHFETTVDDVLEIYTRITNETIDLDKKNPAQA